jgi:C1A family cysteine protease
MKAKVSSVLLWLVLICAALIAFPASNVRAKKPIWVPGGLLPPLVQFNQLGVPLQVPTGPYPAAYDLRALGRVTPARPVNSCGTCWTTATMGSLESFFEPTETWDFSENHMQLFSHGVCGGGGNDQWATAYLVGWFGPVGESDFNYSNPKSNPAVLKHVQNVYFLPPKILNGSPTHNDTDWLNWIKYSIMHFGGVYASISWRGTITNTYYETVDNTCHAVTLVGWDDNFDKSKFISNYDGTSPTQNGAFIAKNNEGPDWGEKGYFYISYYDHTVGTDCAVFTGEPVTNYNRIYQHDPFGPSAPRTVTAAANVFTAAGDDDLAAVGFYCIQAPASYKVKIYLNPPASAPFAAAAPPAAAFDVTLPITGYFTVKLPQKVRLTAGQRFSVVLTSGGLPDPASVLVGVQEPYGLQLNDYTAHPGDSYWLYNYSQGWLDVAFGAELAMPDTSLCIKAYTTAPKIGSVSISNFFHSTTQKLLIWDLANEGTTSASIKPTALLYKQGKRGLVRFGGQVLADYFFDGRGKKVKIRGGWLNILPGSSVRVYSKPVSDKAILASYNAYYTDSLIIKATWFEPWIIARLFKSYINLVSKDPDSGAHINYLGLSAVTVTFDADIKPGPGFSGISVSSPGEQEYLLNSISGKTLSMVAESPFDSELGGTVWTVHLPRDAVVDSFGNGLQQDITWSFTVTGVN